MARDNEFIESYRALKENKIRREQEREKAYNEKADLYAKSKNDYYSLMESIEEKRRRHGQLMESAKDNALSTALKAIYITALEASTLTDDGLILAENMVDSWIKEKGGAARVLAETRNKTYFLARLAQIVEDAAEDDVKKVEDADNDDGKEEEKKEDKKESDEKETKDDSDTEDKEETSEDTEEDDSSDDEDESDDDDGIGDVDEDESDDDVGDDPTLGFEDDDAEESTEDDDSSDVGDEIIDGGDEEDISADDITVDGDTENSGKIFDELDKEEDVKKAIQLIRKRVADAEETFIKNNAEDKKKINELLGKISDNIKTVEDMDEESTEAKIAEESAMIYKRKINNITENRPLNIFEAMTRNLSRSIVKTESMREQFLNEDGNIDTTSIVESARVMYGFLETINTLQLEKVNEAYIKDVLDNM